MKMIDFMKRSNTRIMNFISVIALVFIFQLVNPAQAKNTNAGDTVKNVGVKNPACALLNGPYAKTLSSGTEFALRHLCGAGAKVKTGHSNIMREDISVITDIRVNDPLQDTIADHTTQVETGIAKDTVHGTIVEAYVDDGQFSYDAGGDSMIGWSVSTDNGVTWQDKGKIPTLAGNWLLGSPSLAFHEDSGNLFFAGLMCDPAACNFEKIEVARSQDGGQTWSQIVNAVPQAKWERPFIWIDNTGGACDGHIYLVATDLDTGTLKFTYSSDGGATWSTPEIITTHSNCDTGAVLKVASNGDVYAAWEDIGCLGGSTGIEIRKATVDATCALTWSATVKLVRLIPTPAGDPDATTNCGTNAVHGDIRVRDFPALGVHPTDPNHVYVAYNAHPDNSTSDASNVYFTKSSDGGDYWDAPIKLNDDSTLNDNFMPFMNVADDGKILVGWYDRREDSDNLLMRIWGSLYNGTTWSSNFPISSVLFPPQVNFDSLISPCYMGDNNSVTSDSTDWHIAFGDARRIENTPPHSGPRNDPDAYYAKFALGGPGGILYYVDSPPPGGGDPDGIPEPGETLTLLVELKNVGTAGATGITGVLSTSTPNITIYQANSVYPDLNPGISSSNNTSFVFRISPTVSCGTVISFTLDVTSSAGAFSFPFTVQTGMKSPYTNVFTDTFESGLTQWTVNNICAGDIAWHLNLDTTCSRTGTRPTPNTNIYFGLAPACNYVTGKRECGRITSQSINLTNYPDVKLDFYYALVTEEAAPNNDLASVEISKDNGSSWTTIADNTDKLIDPQGDFFHFALFDISSTGGFANVKIRFVFDTIDALYNDYDGFYIDDVTIKGANYLCDSPGTIDLQPAGPEGKPVVDDSGGSTPNGIIEPDEDVIVEGELHNAGNAIALNTTGILSSTSPITITDNSAIYGDIPGGGNAVCSDCYSLRAPLANRPATHWDFGLTETITAYGFGPIPFNYTGYHVGYSFIDVPPSHLFYSYIEKILHSGVTGGCTTTTYCPAADVQRQQMAKFICRSINIINPGHCVPSGCTGIFSDVTGSNIFCPDIEALYGTGVVAGCQILPTLLYCPLNLTQRGSMAKFVCKAMEIAVPGSCPTVACAGIFDDVTSSNPFCTYIEGVYNAGVVAGCSTSPLQYCPNLVVTRAQMSKFLVNGFGFTL